MDLQTRQRRLKKLLARISPDKGNIEAVSVREGDVLEGIGDAGADREVEAAKKGLELLTEEAELSLEHVNALEAIVLPAERPVVDIEGDSYRTPKEPFVHLDGEPYRANIEKAIPSIGRIELPDHPSLPYGGSGFLVGENLLMTNRHVAELFTLGVGREGLTFREDRSAGIDFKQEITPREPKIFMVERIVMIHPYWDMALLAVKGLGHLTPLTLSSAAPGDLKGRDVAVIGYPALDPRNEVALQNRIFRHQFNVKRMQPGKFRGVEKLQSFGHPVDPITHDSSTLGGNSGSAVIDVETGHVAALHFAGIYLKANYAVPAYELSRDRYVADAGVAFDRDVHPDGTPWDRFWRLADPNRKEKTVEKETAGRGVPAASAMEPGSPVTWSIPLEITVRVGGDGPMAVLGGVRAGGAGAGNPPAAQQERMVEPFHDEDYDSRKGFDEAFLGIRLRLPLVGDESLVSKLDDGSHIIPYEHFSVVMHKKRRLALYAAANIDGRQEMREPESGRKYTRKRLARMRDIDHEKWFTDGRIPANHQLPDKFFTKDDKAFDKGHIIRRDDVTWGESYAEVERANGDTFHVTNCSPQVAGFNRANRRGLWGKLENLILKQAEKGEEKYAIFAGPVLEEDDPVFKGVDDLGPVRVQIPRKYWKVIVVRTDNRLQSFAFLLEQDLSAVALELAVPAAWKSRMISIVDLEQTVKLIEFPEAVHNSDQVDMDTGESLRTANSLERVGG